MTETNMTGQELTTFVVQLFASFERTVVLTFVPSLGSSSGSRAVKIARLIVFLKKK